MVSLLLRPGILKYLLDDAARAPQPQTNNLLEQHARGRGSWPGQTYQTRTWEANGSKNDSCFGWKI